MSGFGRLLLAVTIGCASVPFRDARASETATAEEKPALVASDVRLTAARDQMALEMDFDQPPAFTLHYVDEPPRLILDLPKTVFTRPDTAVKSHGIVKSVRYGTMSEGQARMVITLAEPLRVTHSEAVPGAGGKGAVLRIDGEKITPDAFRALVSAQTWADPQAEKPKDQLALLSSPVAGDRFLVAVDAGHGGIDTGATSPDGETVEKDITLQFARALVDELNARPGFEAFLTRDKDEFISLSRRVAIARERRANLFISLHADKLRQSDIRGATVYTISDRASDTLSASLAERENLSDELAGIAASDEPEEVADILLDLTRRETQAFAVTFADHIIESFRGQVELINNPHRSAGFIVLGAPEIPSVLLELGFLSNRKDVEALTDPERQKLIARLLGDAIDGYRNQGTAKAGQGG